MEMRNEFYDGLLYQIEFRPELSNNDYTQHKVYHIKTEDTNYPHAHNAIRSIMDDDSWSAGQWKLNNSSNPCLANALHTYHQFDYDEDLDCYVYTLVTPYDDLIMFSVYDSYGKPVRSGFPTKEAAYTFITIMSRYDWTID